MTAPPTPPPKPLVLGKGEKRGRGGAKYKLVESGAFEISDHTQDRVSPADSRLPQRLVVTVTLPADVVSYGGGVFLCASGEGLLSFVCVLVL